MAGKKTELVTNRLELDLAETADLIYEHSQDEHTKGDVIHLLGSPGIGKSSIIKQVADKDGASMVTFMASQRERSDLTGPPYLYQPEDPHGALHGKEPIGYTKFYPPKAMLRLTKEFTDQERALHNARRQHLIENKELKKAEEMGEFKEPGKTYLFLDEFANAQPDVQTVYHNLILERSFGEEEYKLRDDVIVVAASNNAKGDGANVYKMSAPLATRLKQIYVKPNVPSWLSWARDANIYEPIRAFIKNRETMLGLQGIDASIKSEAQPTPRSWEKASNSCRCRAYTVNPGDSAETKARKLRNLQALIEGSVGAPAASEFMKFLEFAREAPSAEQIAANPTTTDTFDKNPDIAMVALENMLSGVRRNPKWTKPFLTYSSRMHAMYRQMFDTQVLNLDGDMNSEVINEALDDENFGRLTKTAGRLGQVTDEGDKAGVKLKKRK